MNRRELVNAVAAHTGADAKEVDRTLRGFAEVVTAVVAKGEPVNISGFAKFARQDRAARMGRNPATGEAIKIKASKKAKITPLKAFKDMVLAPSSAPKLAKGVWPPAPVGAAKTAKATGTRTPASKAPAKTAARTAARTTKAAPSRPAAKSAPAAKRAATKTPAKTASARKR